MTSSNLRVRSAYRNALELVVQTVSTPLTMASLTGVTPHLSDDQRQFLIDRVALDGRLYIGTPGLEVANSYFIVVLYPARISVVKAKRCTLCDPSREAMFAQEALAYARENWGAKLGRESGGKYHRLEVSDEMLAALGLPIRPHDLTVVHFVSSVGAPVDMPKGSTNAQMVNAHIGRVFAGEIECIEHCGQQWVERNISWEMSELPAKVLAHFGRHAARKAA
jgi:hypothetical protein